MQNETIEIDIRPFPAVRTTGKGGRFTPRAKGYHDKMNMLRSKLSETEIMEIRENLKWWYSIDFVFACPESWSKKKKEEHIGRPHTNTPDLDNLCKSFFDTIFYGCGTEDSSICFIHAAKFWGEKDKIIFTY